MPKFKFAVSRELSESTWAEVEADTIEEAQERALEMADKGQLEGWEIDYCVGKSYLPDEKDYEVI